VNKSSLAKCEVGARAATPRAARPKLLVSVRDASEAAAALAGGADWIDLKEPLAGPLGAVDAAIAREVVDRVAGRCTISAALGELATWTTTPAKQLLEVPGIDFVKLGRADCAEVDPWDEAWLAAERAVRQAGKSLVAVLYADWQRAQSPEPERIVALAGQSACQYLLIDTFDKSSSGTLGCLGSAGLSNLLQLARQHSLSTVVAGKIRLEELAKLPTTSVDMVAVRGGVCPSDRRGQVDERLVEQFQSHLAAHWPNRSGTDS
jgi:uncharacterized protein (UPF0264 family)